MAEQRQHRFERGTDGPEVIVAGIDGSDSSRRAAAGHRFVGSVAVRLVKAGRRPVTAVP
ncbi:hypothetical protein [Streptomyces sp. ADI96-02]|uniref:hypothetical protein n=1 Tax=Streptomyces sp. ADI96-02 TaxID=1522760 RepID=UPI0013DE0516|nr:hypothetical protein [Streptomyces sp. ADI96-02]